MLLLILLSFCKLSLTWTRQYENGKYNKITKKAVQIYPENNCHERFQHVIEKKRVRRKVKTNSKQAKAQLDLNLSSRILAKLLHHWEFKGGISLYVAIFFC